MQYLIVRGTDLFSLRLSNFKFKKKARANATTAIQCELIKIISIFVILTKIYFLVC